MSKRTFLDTSYLIALLNRRDQFHERAVELSEAYRGQRFLLTDAVLIEIADSLAGRFRREAIALIERLLASPEVDLVRTTPTLFSESWQFFRAYQDKDWGMTDCISFVVMRREGVEEALAFDHHFTQAGFQTPVRGRSAVVCSAVNAPSVRA